MTPFLSGPRVYFRPYDEKDARQVFVWFNDPEVTHFMFTGQKPATQKQITDLMNHDKSSGHNVIFIAVDKETDAPLGVVGLYEINETAKKAEMRIIIGNKDFWGKGYGTEITEMITFYGFDRLNMHRVYLGFTEANQAATKAYSKAGFEHEGVLRDDIYRNSSYYNTVRMGILRDDYYKRLHSEHKAKYSLESQLA